MKAIIKQRDEVNNICNVDVAYIENSCHVLAFEFFHFPIIFRQVIILLYVLLLGVGAHIGKQITY